MANDKYSGYSPKKEETLSNEGSPGSGTRLDKVNPYEFRKGMDIELTNMGISRLAESLPEEREKATETVLNNLNEHQAYYSFFINYQTEFRNKEKKPTFKKYLAELADNNWKEFDKRDKKIGEEIDKNRQMTEPKYDKSEYTVPFKGSTEQLKEAIKNEVINLLKEEEDKEPPKTAKKDITGLKGAQLQKKFSANLKKIKDLESKRQKKFDAAKEKEKGKDADTKAKLRAAYIKDVDSLQDEINDLKKENEEIKKIQEGKILEEKSLRREVAKTMMDKDTHMEILKIIKEAGVPMNEGAASVKAHYEIAKISYQEGMMAGLNK